MKIIPPLIILIGFVALFFIGYFLGARSSTKGLPDTTELKALQRERDSIAVLLSRSRTREEQYIIQAERDSVASAELLVKIATREKKIKTYEQRLLENERIHIKLDSFFIKRYEH